MATIRRPITLLALLAAAAVAVLAMSPVASTASANACDAYGNTNPTELTRKQARRAMRCLINAQRDAAGLHSLDRSRKLQRAAQRHNNRMIDTGCFAHECPGETSLGGRLDLVGYLTGGLTRWLFGEVLGWGVRDRGTPRSIVAAWMGSAEHRVYLLNPSYREIGVGFSVGTPSGGSDAGGVYTTDFGLRRR